MWQKQVINLIKEHEIASVDIRYLAENGNWETITIPANRKNLCLYMNQICKDLQLQQVSTWLSKNKHLIRYFIDPFLAHRTLVILTDKYKVEAVCAGIKSQFKQKILVNEAKDVDIGYDINFEYEVKATDYITRLPASNYLSPSEDLVRDIRTEVVLALSQMKVNVLKHYANYLISKDATEEVYNNILTIHQPIYALETNNDNSSLLNITLLNGIDDIQKIKYTILMVGKAYNIKVNINRGIFKDFKNPLEVIAQKFYIS